jgi:two-component system, NtrC family, response regulator HydG
VIQEREIVLLGGAMPIKLDVRIIAATNRDLKRVAKFDMELGKNVQRTAEKTLKLLMRYDWPGNVRELENAVERVMVITKENTLKLADFNFDEQPFESEAASGGDKSMRSVEKEHILIVLTENDFNIQKSAEILDIDRVTLYNKIKKYDLKRGQ